MIEAQERIPLISNFDPLAAILRKRVSPLGFCLLFLLANLIVDLFLGWRYGVFTSLSIEGKQQSPLINNLTALVVDFVSEPVIAGIYLWTTLGATQLFQRLQVSRIFASENLVAEKVDRRRSLFASRRVFHAIWIAALIYAISQVAAYMGWVPWKSAGGYLEQYPVASFYRLLFWFLNFYTLAFAAFNVFMTVKVLRDLFRSQSVNLLVLHPDRCGGLSSISSYSVKIAYAIASAGLVISAATVFEIRQGNLANALPILIGIVVYAGLAPIFFFWPLGTAHEAMRQAKENELLELALLYDHLYTIIMRRAGHLQAIEKVSTDAAEGKHGADDDEADMRRLENLQKLYAIAEKFPVWPFNAENLRRFFGVITAPIIPIFISIAIELLTPIFVNIFSNNSVTP